MTAVIVRYSLEVVEDEKIKQLLEATVGVQDDNVAIPGLPDVTYHAITGISKGHEPLNVARLQNEVIVATGGDSPSEVLLVRVGDIPG